MFKYKIRKESGIWNVYVRFEREDKPDQPWTWIGFARKFSDIWQGFVMKNTLVMKNTNGHEFKPYLGHM